MKKSGSRPVPGSASGAWSREAYGDPYRRVRRPQRQEGAQGVTVSLDPDVAQVFRGAAAVNKALRLVIQLLAVTAARPRLSEATARARRGYRGSEQARGFKRKPRVGEE